MIPRLFVRRWFQPLCQGASLLALNGYVAFFTTFQLYQGPLKNICLPVLNCHSCPAALFACPIGALQYFIMTHRLPLYVLSSLALVGITLGRLSCGLVCPFGFLQDVIFKIGSVRIELPRWCRHIKYAVLFGVVCLISYVFAVPAFCKICPVAVLEAGFPLALHDPAVSQRIFNTSTGVFTGWLFVFKTVCIGVLLVASASIKRPFCRILCPLGAFLGLFNRYSLLRLDVNRDACTGCEKCARICPVDLNLMFDANSAECVRCMKCTACDHVKAKHVFSFFRRENNV